MGAKSIAKRERVRERVRKILNESSGVPEGFDRWRIKNLWGIYRPFLIAYSDEMRLKSEGK